MSTSDDPAEPGLVTPYTDGDTGGDTEEASGDAPAVASRRHLAVRILRWAAAVVAVVLLAIWQASTSGLDAEQSPASTYDAQPDGDPDLVYPILNDLLENGR